MPMYALFPYLLQRQFENRSVGVFAGVFPTGRAITHPKKRKMWTDMTFSKVLFGERAVAKPDISLLSNSRCYRSPDFGRRVEEKRYITVQILIHRSEDSAVGVIVISRQYGFLRKTFQSSVKKCPNFHIPLLTED